MIYRLLFSFCFILFSLNLVKAQPSCVFTHYSSEHGLSQNSITDMVQDKNGNLWFATWDGINRFNGYDFKVYKASLNNQLALANTRVDFIEVDECNMIWMQTYDNRIFRLNQATECFEQVLSNGDRCEKMKMLPNGNMWLLLKEKGAVRAWTNPENHSLQTEIYADNRGYGELDASVYDVFMDSNGQEWLLSGNGLLKINGEESLAYFSESKLHKEKTAHPFYAACNVNDTIYFGSDKGRIWRYSMKDEIFDLWELPFQDKIIAIKDLSELGLLVVTRTQGMVLYSPVTGKYHLMNRKNIPNFPTDAIRSVYIDREQIVWFELTQWGRTFRYDPKNASIKVFETSVEPQGADRSYPPFQICEDTVNHYLWVHPQGGGLSWYDREHDNLIPFYNNPKSTSWKFSNKIHSMLVDKQGNLWFSTHSKGLEKATFYGRQFSVFPTMGNKGLGLDESTVRALYKDSNGRLWMSKRNGKVEVYDSLKNYLGYLTEMGTIAKNGIPLEGVTYHMMRDSDGFIWLSTKGRGIIRLEPTGDRFKLRRFEYDEKDLYSLSHNNVYWLHEDGNGRLWAATFGGGLNLLQKTENDEYQFINSRNKLKGFPIDECYRVRHIASDSVGNVWVGTTSGVVCFKKDFKMPESIQFHYYKRNLDGNTSLSSNNVYHIICTRKGEVYMATFGGGLMKLETIDDAGNATFKAYTRAEGLLSDILLSVEEDEEGNLWISTESGLSKFLVEEQRFEHYNERNFGDKVRFEESTSLSFDTGIMTFGTTNGILYFSTQDVKKSEYVPPIYWVGLKIANKEVEPNDAKGILSQSLNSTECLELSYKDDMVAISYAALDYDYPENIRYAYFLEGFDKEWNYVDRLRTATYTNLPPGKYVFRVKSTNSDGIWVNNERGINLYVSPSFWETPLAICMYILILFTVFGIAIYILFTIYRLKHKVSVEQQVSDVKLKFFTNISHELRTPLTLIAGPIEYVMKNEELSENVRNQLKIVERNTDRMLRMVNQILDFRKIQKNKMKLRIEKMNVVPFVRQIMDNFEALAEAHHIDFVFESEKTLLELWVDADKLEKIIFNLLSNAFKYTPQGKMITLFIHENENSVAIGIQDQGIGIPENKKASIFMRFENLIDKNLFNQQSSGIGLSLVKELVELHQATIRVDSKVGEGSCFIVEFQKGKEHYSEDVELIVSDNLNVSDVGENISMVDLNEKTEGEISVSGERKTMLLVEDNLELRFFLRSIFNSFYDVLEAADGMEGLEKAKKFVPDIIISDIMMPAMDGLVMVKEIRENLTTSHIPIILLTAKTDMETQLCGVEQGADDYITKPFSAMFLKAKVDNMLARRSRLQQMYRANLMNEPDLGDEAMAESKSEMSEQDRKFMDKLVELMEKNMENGNLLVDDLVKELTISRSVFFKKLKSLTGLAPVEFIKEMRVKRAAKLIEVGRYSMTQITYMVGFNDSRYFSKCFKQHYGMTPTEYKEANSIKK